MAEGERREALLREALLRAARSAMTGVWTAGEFESLKRGSGPQRWISMGEKGPSGREKRREGGLGFGFGLISCFGFRLGSLFLFYSISKTNKHV